MAGPETRLIQLAVALGAATAGGPLSAAERALVKGVASRPEIELDVEAATKAIWAGEDPLGERFCALRDQATRRAHGAVYTPTALITPMVDWVLDHEPDRVVDAGCGSGRFVAEALRRAASFSVVAVDIDPVATLMTRAVLAVLGATNARVIQGDYTRVKLSKINGRTAYIGNPPYVRHHQLEAAAKDWAQTAAGSLGHKISGLAGLHAHFFLATAVLGRKGDIGCFVTSAEWLDVNYGAIMRTLVLEDLGGESLHIVEPTAMPFEGTATTAVITAFKIGRTPDAIRVQDIQSLDDIKELATAGRPIARQRLVEESRWSGLLRSAPKAPEGFIELGELCSVHRGAVTGANSTWVRQHGGDLPQAVLFPSVTKARELFAAGAVLEDASRLRVVVDIPPDLDELDDDERQRVEKFIRAAKRAGAHKGYVAEHRRAWWSVGLRQPAPILATYMARRPPAFVRNAAEARHINIAHGLYPRQALGEHVLSRIAQALRTGVVLAQGRAYAGGLTKFEPKEMERLMIPDLATLRGHDPLTAALDA